ncbi:LVIVD repeat-containing protein [Neptunitalea lumnitzerae]|uniref:LVIVD repeat-containing protein n=1 Tax=Neptunitalea lumnitzerae TaxID=2965509 RepID=A0ABQ5MIP5_9FLAO|nr:hypothetical protein [Neptunitalea sp. Y10]GLB49196.1 hypothetical protein Y10_15640 [Neptunitalea sp. Y10]
MKKLYISFFTIMLLMACSQDSDSFSSSNLSSDTGKAGSLARFIVVGDYMYTVDHSNLKVFSVTNNTNPVLVNTVNIGFNIETIFNYRNYLYIGSNNGMYIYAIDNAEMPSYLSEAWHFTSCDPVVANLTHAFVTLHSETWCGNNINSLEIYDVTDVTNPILISSRNLTYPKGLGLYHNYLIVCDDEVKIFDVSDPEASVLVTSINKEAFDVIINGNQLILVGDTGVYQYLLDSNNIENITELSTIAI